jgi:hypothetical protein
MYEKKHKKLSGWAKKKLQAEERKPEETMEQKHKNDERQRWRRATMVYIECERGT